MAVLPVVAAHSCLAPFWLTQAYANGCGWLPFAGTLLTAFVAPAYLAVLGYRLILRRIHVATSFGLSLIVSVLLLNFFLDYTLWGIGSGYFWTPDEGTLEIMRLEVLVGSVIVMLTLFIALVIRLGLQHTNRKA